MEYELQDAQEPHLFVIRKQQRWGPKSTSPLHFYYILDGNVYQAPSLHATLSSRLVIVPAICLSAACAPSSLSMHCQSGLCFLQCRAHLQSVLLCAMQSRCLYNVRAGFKLMQNDLDPLLKGEATGFSAFITLHAGQPTLGLQQAKYKIDVRKQAAQWTARPRRHL